MAQGLLNRVVPAAELDAAVEALLGSLLARPREALALGKALFYRQRELGIEAAYQLAGQTMAHNLMLDQHGMVWLLDFDRGALRAPARDWQQDNLARLQRSLRKLGADRFETVRGMGYRLV